MKYLREWRDDFLWSLIVIPLWIIIAATAAPHDPMNRWLLFLLLVAGAVVLALCVINYLNKALHAALGEDR